MSALHNLKITSPTGDAVLTTVEMDGKPQYVSQFDIGFRMDTRTGRADGIEVRLIYPYCSATIELDQVAVKQQFSARLYIPGFDGISANGYGDTIAAALRDMADRMDAGQAGPR